MIVKKDNKDRKDRFELADHKTRHIYEKSSDYELETKTKFSTCSNKSNIYDSFAPSYIIRNDMYDCLFLFSRGVIDCLS